MDLTKYTLSELYEKFEEIDRKKELFETFKKSILEKKARLQEKQEFSLETLESILERPTYSPLVEDITFLNEQLSKVSNEYQNELQNFRSEVAWYIHYETRRRIKRKRIDLEYEKALDAIVSNFEKIKSINIDIQNINDEVVREVDRKHSVSGCRTETGLEAITPFFRIPLDGFINLSKEIHEAKEWLKQSPPPSKFF